MLTVTFLFQYSGGVLKDSVVMPPGGAVVVRLFTNNPGTWFAHCHMDHHKSDGMAFILQEGELNTNLSYPNDYPSCNYTGRLQRKEQISCECYEDADAILNVTPLKGDKCSSYHLCRHKLKEKVKRPMYKHGIGSHAPIGVARWIIPALTTTMTFLVYTLLQSRLLRCASSDEEVENVPSEPKSYSFGRMFYLELLQAQRECISMVRLVEVIGLALITGALFYNVGEKNSNRNLRETFSLLFFSTTLWTFTRMYPSVVEHNKWRERALTQILQHATPVHHLVTARVISYILVESWWPILYSSIAFPLAHVVGEPMVWFGYAIRLLLNALCYILFGAVAGLGVKEVPIAMIIVTLYGQGSLLCAGFFRTLPSWLQWCRYLSFLFYTYSGIIRSGYRWYESYKCVNGDSRLGPNHCFLTSSASMDDFRIRGIDIAELSEPEVLINAWEDILVNLAYTVFMISMLFLIMHVHVRWRPQTAGR